MKKVLHSLIAITLFFGMATTSFGQLFMDGDSTDWEGYPVLIDAPNNPDGYFPSDVGAAVSDIVDIKTVKAVVIGNVLYTYLELWGGPAWPIDADTRDHEGTDYWFSRGYYHLLLDIDNDVTTGWNTEWYEAHLTPVGYLMSQGITLEPIGAEVMHEWGAQTRDSYQVEVDGEDPIEYVSYWAADWQDYDSETDNGSDYEIFNMDVPNPDSASMMQWQGSLKINSSDDPAMFDSLKSYWNGHGWGHSFLEFAMELTPYQMYYKHKNGIDVLQPGDVIGLCGMTETPVDDWGVDITTRAEITLPMDIPVRPNKITFDGDESDWADVPLLIEAPNNPDGYFPSDVGAAVSDIVDVKEVKAFIENDNLYFLLKLWGGPAWPIDADTRDHEGTDYWFSRGYYHILMDIDNDVTTGWDTEWYEAHLTPVGYLMSQGQTLEAIGAEVMYEWGAQTRDSYQVEVDGEDPIEYVSYWAADWQDYDSETDNGSDFEIFNYDIMGVDSTLMMHHDGMLLNNSSDDPATIDGNPDWNAHGWGYDFIEVGGALRTLRMYYKNKNGTDVLQQDDVIGIVGMTETPVDDWGVDITTRGEISVNVVGVSDNKPAMVEKFSLANNYPNPFNPSTKIQYTLPTNEFVSLKVYDIIGREVATLVNQQQSAGVYDVNFNASNLTSGIYFYKIDAGSFVDVKKMMLLK